MINNLYSAASFDPNMLKDLSIYTQVFPFLDQSLNSSIVFTDQLGYNNIITSFKNGTTDKISKGDKFFILPCNPLTKEKIKHKLKPFKASITDDIEKATIVLTNENFYNKSEDDISRYLMKESRFMFSSAEGNLLRYYPYYYKYRHLNSETKANDFFILTPLLISYLHTIKTKKLKIINLDNFIKSTDIGLVLNEELYQNLFLQLFSNDINDVKIGVNTLLNSDYSSSESMYFIRELTKVPNDPFYRLRMTKDIKYFLLNTKWFNIKNQSIEEYIQDKNKLNNKYKNDLIKEALEYNLNKINNITCNLYEVNFIENLEDISKSKITIELKLET